MFLIKDNVDIMSVLHYIYKHIVWYFCVSV